MCPITNYLVTKKIRGKASVIIPRPTKKYTPRTVMATPPRTVWPNSLGPKKRKEAKEKKHDNTTPLGVCCIVIREIRENPVTKQGEKPQTTQKSHTLWCLREVHHIRYGLDDQPLHVWHHACNTVFLRFPSSSPITRKKGKEGDGISPV